jgi:hypothetical protein
MICSPFCLCLAPLSAHYICTQVIPCISHRSRLSSAELILPGSFNALRVCFMATHPLLDHNVPLTGRCFCKGRRTFQRCSGPFRDFLPGVGSMPDSNSLGILRGPSMRTGMPRGEHRSVRSWQNPLWLLRLPQREEGRQLIEIRRRNGMLDAHLKTE